MSGAIRITRAGPLTTVQDAGRVGMLRRGITASGPMDRTSFALAGAQWEQASAAGIEITAAGIAFEVVEGVHVLGMAGGVFAARLNGAAAKWPGALNLKAGDRVDITPGSAGNFGYLRFDRDLVVPAILGSVSTNSRIGLGCVVVAGDVIEFGELAKLSVSAPPPIAENMPIRFIWGLHAGLFPLMVRQHFVTLPLAMSPQMDRMGLRLQDPAGIFGQTSSLSLVSDPIVAGDIQIMGDGTPIILMRDHQPTGGYPRIATVIAADIDRVAQLRPGTEVRFSPISVDHAHALTTGTRSR